MVDNVVPVLENLDIQDKKKAWFISSLSLSLYKYNLCKTNWVHPTWDSGGSSGRATQSTTEMRFPVSVIGQTLKRRLLEFRRLSSSSSSSQFLFTKQLLSIEQSTTEFQSFAASAAVPPLGRRTLATLVGRFFLGFVGYCFCVGGASREPSKSRGILHCVCVLCNVN